MLCMNPHRPWIDERSEPSTTDEMASFVNRVMNEACRQSSPVGRALSASIFSLWWSGLVFIANFIATFLCRSHLTSNLLVEFFFQFLREISPPSWELIPVPSMKRQRSSNLELDDEDEWDEFKPLFDYSETLGPAPTLLSDDSDEDDLVITSGPPQLRPKISPAKKDPAPKVILEDDDDESWMMPAPPKLPSTLPGPGYQTLQALRSRRKELMMLQESSTPEAITRVEDQARMQAQKRPEVVQSPLVLNTPNSSKVHGKSPMNEAEEKEKILIKVLNKDGDIQPIRIFTTDKFEKLFKVYAEVFNLSLANLSFRFDGEQLTPNSTPKYHNMEDGELIEVYNKI